MILASASPRRRELMGLTGIPFEILVSEAPEITEGEPGDIVRENARRKALAVCALRPGRFVLGADTLVFAGGKPLGKPRDREDALRMLRLLQNGWHEVYTGICLTDGSREYLNCDVTKVHFVPMSEKQMLDYIATGEPMDKAGAYAVQGRGGMYIDRLEGNYATVIGLNTCMVRQMLEEAGLA
ncbi:MAG: septum formation protein Maf [Clostridiales bacterium]|nr:septum formation protein Maf [Clostridiales bacterium]